MLPARSGRLRSALLTAFWRGEKEMKIERKSACRCGCAGGLNLLCTDEGVSEGEGESKKKKTLGGCGCAIGQIVRHTVEGLFGEGKTIPKFEEQNFGRCGCAVGQNVQRTVEGVLFWREEKEMKKSSFLY